jgi:hypothetical protein
MGSTARQWREPVLVVVWRRMFHLWRSFLTVAFTNHGRLQPTRVRRGRPREPRSRTNGARVVQLGQFGWTELVATDDFGGAKSGRPAGGVAAQRRHPSAPGAVAEIHRARERRELRLARSGLAMRAHLHMSGRRPAACSTNGSSRTRATAYSEGWARVRTRSLTEGFYLAGTAM